MFLCILAHVKLHSEMTNWNLLQVAEYGIGSQASIYGDIYSYGILLLEMFTGKSPTDDMFKDDQSLHNFIEVALPEHVMGVVDLSMLSEEENREEERVS